jgi:hypothetical protein
MTFNIGSQQAAALNNVAGDQYINGGQHAVVGAPAEVLAALQNVRAGLAELHLNPSDHARAAADLADLDAQLATGAATKNDAADRLTRLADAARRAGVLVTAASGLGAAIVTLGQWLGPLGAGLLRLLG